MNNDIDIIKSIHAKYFDYMVNGDMDNVAKLFHYPSAFKGFLENLSRFNCLCP